MAIADLHKPVDINIGTAVLKFSMTFFKYLQVHVQVLVPTNLNLVLVGKSFLNQLAPPRKLTDCTRTPRRRPR
eukprot:SAG31_NODE_4664_length_3056_cov_3.064592_2_plen_73_part_00